MTQNEFNALCTNLTIGDNTMQTLRIYAFNGSDVVRIVEQDIDTTLAKTASFLEMILKETDEKITHLEYAIN